MSGYSCDQMVSFIHIPKCAGTAIRRQMTQLPGWRDFDTIDEKIRDKRDPALANHFPVWKIYELLDRANIPDTELPFTRMVKFMVVRNPFERMVSLYRHRMKKLRLDYKGKPRNTPEDIAIAEQGFIPWLLTTPSEGDGVLTKMPQHDWGVWGDGRFVMDFVLRQENLQEDWARLCANRRWPFGELSVVNTTGGSKDYRDEYNLEARQHVEKYFERDLEGFDYAF